MNRKFEIDYIGLENFLLNLSKADIETTWSKPENPKLEECVLASDVEHFKMEDYDEDRFVDFGEPFLVDALGNDLSILILSKRKHKLPTGRVVNSKFDKTIVNDCRGLYGTPLNGCWKIPKEFIKPASKIKTHKEIIGTTGYFVDLMNKELTKEEWKAIETVHKMTNRVGIQIKFEWSKSIDVRNGHCSQIIDETVFKNK